jgi:hypothetical protein
MKKKKFRIVFTESARHFPITLMKGIQDWNAKKKQDNNGNTIHEPIVGTLARCEVVECSGGKTTFKDGIALEGYFLGHSISPRANGLVPTPNAFLDYLNLEKGTYSLHVEEVSA